MSTSTPLSKVSPHILALAAKINEAIVFDADGASTMPDTFFAENCLPEGVTMEIVGQVQTAEMDFADALLLGHGDKSREHLLANPTLERTTVIAKAGNDELRASHDRKIMVRAPGSTEEKPKYGASNLKLTSDIGRKVGNFRRIQEHLNETATSVFSS